MVISRNMLLAALTLSAACLFSQEIGGGIEFIKNDYRHALETARTEDQIIFIDAYTTWCGPCKMMDQQIFTDSVVSSFFNSNYINLKLDMERGEGLDVAKKFGVRAYPTFLFIDADENLLHRGIGFQPVEKFLQLGQEAKDPTRQIGSLALAHKRGDRSPKLLYDYSLALLNAGDEQGLALGAEYLDQQENWATSKNMILVRRLVRSFDDRYFDFMVSKKHLFFKEFGESNINALLLNLMQRHYYSKIDQVDLSAVKESFGKVFTASKAVPFYDLFEMNYYDVKGDLPAYQAAAKTYVKKYPNLSWSTLNQIAWTFYEKVDDTKALKWAKNWAKKSIAKDSNHFNNDTLAAIYYKLKKKKPASKFAHRAISLAEDAGAPHDETTALLSKIEAL